MGVHHEQHGESTHCVDKFNSFSSHLSAKTPATSKTCFSIFENIFSLLIHPIIKTF